MAEYRPGPNKTFEIEGWTVKGTSSKLDALIGVSIAQSKGYGTSPFPMGIFPNTKTIVLYGGPMTFITTWEGDQEYATILGYHGVVVSTMELTKFHNVPNA